MYDKLHLAVAAAAVMTPIDHAAIKSVPANKQSRSALLEAEMAAVAQLKRLWWHTSQYRDRKKFREPLLTIGRLDLFGAL